MDGCFVTRGKTSALVRLFFVQGSMNSKRLQALGTAFAIEPLIRDLKNGPRDHAFEQAIARAVQFFNTHPYLSGIAVGAAAKTELEGAPPKQVERLWAAVKGPLGAVGDQLVWAGFLPILVAGAVILAALGHWVIGIVGFLVTFNLVHFFLRIWGLTAGLRFGLNVAGALRSAWLVKTLRTVGPVAAFMAGVLVPVAGQWLLQNFERNMYWGGWAIAGVTVILSTWLLPTTGAARIGLMTVFVVLLGGILW